MKQIRLLFVFGLMFLLTGCVQKYEYSEAQSNEAAEYIAGLLLKSDKDYTLELIPMNELMGKTSSAIATKSTASGIAQTKATLNIKEGVSTPAEPEKVSSLTEVLGKEDITLQYSGYKITDSYPEDKSPECFSITPENGNRLVVVSFTITNTSKKAKTIDLSKAKLTYQLDVNNGTVYEPPFTVLENDLKYLKASLKSGEEKPVILLFEIKNEAKIKKINLTVSDSNKTNTIKMQ